MTGSSERACLEERRAKRLLLVRPQGPSKALIFLAVVLLVLALESRTYWAALGHQLQLRRVLVGSPLNDTTSTAVPGAAAAEAAAAAAGAETAFESSGDALSAPDSSPETAGPGQQPQHGESGVLNDPAANPFLYSAIGLRLQQQIAAGSRVEWLHLPKTGTSFGNTLIPWVCPRLPDGWQMRKNGLPKGGVPDVCLAKFKYDNTSVMDWRLGDHVGLEDRSDNELSRVFTMVRSPRERLVSGFHHVHRYKRVNASNEEICAFGRSTLVSHASTGTQVRMIMGDHVSTGVVHPVGMWRLFDTIRQPSTTEAELACRRLKRFAFVGLTSYWDASICLFHAIYGGRVRPNEYKNMRKGVHHDIEEAAKQVDCGDRADDRLYQCGVEWFLDKLKQYPMCAQELDTAAIAEEARAWAESGSGPDTRQ